MVNYTVLYNKKMKTCAYMATMHLLYVLYAKSDQDGFPSKVQVSMPTQISVDCAFQLIIAQWNALHFETLRENSTLTVHTSPGLTYSDTATIRTINTGIRSSFWKYAIILPTVVKNKSLQCTPSITYRWQQHTLSNITDFMNTTTMNEWMPAYFAQRQTNKTYKTCSMPCVLLIPVLRRYQIILVGRVAQLV
jgi:hypothetical protein